IEVENNGLIRQLDGFTDADGKFVQQFTPLAGESGNYNVKAYFPDNQDEDNTYEDSFKILGASFASENTNHQVIADTPFSNVVTLENTTDTPLTGITAEVIGVPENWDVQVNVPSTLAGDGSNEIEYTISAPNNSYITQDRFNIQLTSNEGVSASLPVNVNLERSIPKLVATIGENTLTGSSPLESGMLRGEQTSVEVTITNEGGAIAENIDILLPDTPWLSLASPQTIESLEPGESTSVTFLLSPDAEQDLTLYQGSIGFDVAGNDGDLSLPYEFRAVSEAVGSLQVNVVDELFYYAEGAPKLDDANVVLRDYFTGEEIARVTTDETGMVNLDGLPEGYYTLEVRADEHDTFRQTIEIDAGESEVVNSFLPRQTVKYTWTVRETQIEDRYDIQVNSVFETDVPVPTVVIDPPQLDLADLQVVGQVKQIEIDVTNHGLIAANNLELNFGEHPFYKIEPLLDEIGSLDAKSSLTIPVRITRIADLDTLDTSSGDFSTSSTPNVPCGIDAQLDFDYICGPAEVNRSTAIAINGVDGNCPPRFGGGGGGGAGGGAGTIGSTSPRRIGTSSPGSYASSTPIEIEPVDIDCCPDISYTKDVSGLVKPIAKAAEAVVDRYIDTTPIGSFVDVKIDAKAKAKVSLCCENFGLGFNASAKIDASVTGGGSKKVNLSSSLNTSSGKITASGSGSAKVEAKLSSSISGGIDKDCGDPLDVSVKGNIGLSFEASLKGSASLSFSPNAAASSAGLSSSTASAEALGGLFGSVNYKFEYSLEDGFT
ncbi:MAG: carboxypeptidase regulatory-like domain-containing protein, partial [Cyanobacteria bacterium J06631_2]